MLLAALIAQVLAPAEVDVSPTGTVRTVAGAVEIARRLLRTNPVGVEIHVRPGSYRIDHTILLTAADSNLQIIGVGGNIPRLIGGKRLITWRPVTDPAVLSRLRPAARANVRECELAGDDGIGDLGELTERGFGLPSKDAGLELFFNGKPMQLARYPNADAANGGWLRIGATPTRSSISYPGSEPGRWLRSDDIWAFGYWQFDWAESYERVTRLDALHHAIEFNEAHFAYPPMPGRRFYFLNVLDELDQPGEWYLDRRSRRIYFWPPTPIDKGEVIASTLTGPMFRVVGALGVRVANLDLESGRGGGIAIEGGAQNWVRSCLIRNFGTSGVTIDGAQDSGVAGCDLTGLGEMGIRLAGGDRKTLEPAHLLAEDNHIWNYSRWCRTYQPAIAIYGVGNAARNNRIHDAPHQAILLGGNDHIVEKNDIANVCTETGDAGAIYMGRDTTMRGNIIRFNRFQNLAPRVNTSGNFTEVMGVYLDDCFAGTTVTSNIFDMRGDGIMLGGGRDNTITNNVFLDCHPAIHVDARGKSWAAKYFVPNGEWDFFQKIAAVNASRPPYSTHYPRLANILRVDVAFPAGNSIDSNVCLGGEWLRLLDHLTIKDLENRDNIVQPKLGTFREAMRTAAKSFIPIPLGQIGLLTKQRPIDRLKDPKVLGS